MMKGLNDCNLDKFDFDFTEKFMKDNNIPKGYGHAIFIGRIIDAYKKQKRKGKRYKR